MAWINFQQVDDPNYKTTAGGTAKWAGIAADNTPSQRVSNG